MGNPNDRNKNTRYVEYQIDHDGNDDNYEADNDGNGDDEEDTHRTSNSKQNSYSDKYVTGQKHYQLKSNTQQTVSRKGYYDNFIFEYYKLRYGDNFLSSDMKEHNVNWDDDTSNDDFDGDNTVVDSNPSTVTNSVKLSAEKQRERKDWQSFLSSVLTGEVIKSEKQRINSNTRQAANNNNQIWLGIRAVTHGYQLSEEKQILDEKRRQIDVTLKEVINFQVQLNDVSALVQVTELLQKVDFCESLYPTRKAMMSDKPLYKSENFQYNLDALNSWLTITRSLQTQLKILQDWTGSKNLEITKPKDSPADAENPSFLERILKENSLKQTFEKKTLSTLNSLLSKAKRVMIENADSFVKMKLPPYINEFQQLLNFPTKLMEECMKLLLEISGRLTDPTMLMIQQRMDDFRISLILACQIKLQYLKLITPATGWEIPSCIDENYNTVLLESLKFYLKLLQWKVKGGYKTVFFKEAEILENEWSFVSGICRDIAGGEIEVAEQFCTLTNKLLQSVLTYYESKLELPKNIDAANIYKWYNKILESVRLRSHLENTNHVLVYPDTFNEDNVCFIVEQSLYNRSEQIQKLLKVILTPYEKDDHEEELKGAEYILVLSPRVPFEWNGSIMVVSLGNLNIELKNHHTRLVANGSYTRLQACKQKFRGVAENCNIKVLLETLNIIIDSIRKIREMTKNLQCQELIENCFSFATEIGQRCMKYLDRDAVRNQLNVKLTRMAIDWVSFICDDCVPTDRKTFRWAVIALEFAMVANRGSNIFGLSEEEFNWTGSKNLEITKPKDSPADAENPSFLERILKENSLKQTFEKKTLSTLNSLLSKAKRVMIENADSFVKMKLPPYINEFQQLLNFPTKLMEECMKLLLEISGRLTDPTMLMIQQRMDDFRISLILACQIKLQYLKLITPATGWEIPSCIDENYNTVLLESLKFYLKLLQWKVKGGYKTVFFKEAEILENEWSFVSGICRDIAGGEIEVAEQFCTLTNKLLQSVLTYYESKLELPKNIDAANIYKWYNKILESVRLRSQLKKAHCRNSAWHPQSPALNHNVGDTKTSS
ncbi:10572_t:CDS:2 [Entrophospora sp. SA101]|nr:10572_t:CDS:2 [Entrophospora sp. SA101]